MTAQPYEPVPPARGNRWQDWANLLLAAWLFIAPWVLGFAQAGNASWNHWMVGALIFLIALSGLAAARRSLATSSMAHAGDKPPRRL